MLKKTLHVTSFLFLLLCILFLYSCPNFSDTEPTTIRLSFSSNDKARDLKSEGVVSSILISIKKKNGPYILNLAQFKVYPMGNMFITDPIDFSGQDGIYRVTDFLVLNNEERVTYATPKAGSEKAEMVSSPLPYEFEVSNGMSVTVPLEVLEVDSSSNPGDFGYVTFGFVITQPALQKGIVAEYLLNGNGDDTSGNNNHANLTPGSFTTDRSGNAGSAYEYADSSDTIEITHPLYGEQISISMWYFYNTSDGDSISLASDTTKTYHHIMINQTTGEIGFYNEGWFSSGLVMVPGNWYHVAVVKDASLSKLYINGTLVQEVVSGFNNDDHALSFLGSIVNPTLPDGMGVIDDIKIYDRKISGHEVELLYTDQVPEVDITYPSDGSTVSGMVTVTASAFDNDGIAEVKFYINGQLAGTDTSPPYIHLWETDLVLNGQYEIMAKAYDTIGQVKIDDDTHVYVNNALHATQISVAAGSNFSVAVLEDGTVWSWGYNNTYQLGDGTGTTSYTPVRVNGLTNVLAVAAGNSHALVLKNDHTVWGWGYNGYGELGDGSTINKAVPVKALNLGNITAIACGSEHSLALKDDGTVWGFGQNNNGELGLGTTSTNEVIPVQIPGLDNVIAIAGGGDYSMVLKNDGTVWTTGYNQYGRLGDGTTTQKTTFTQVTGLDNVIAIACGAHHSHAVKNDGTVWSWGYNGNGELGDATQTTSYTPVKVNGLTGITSLAAGDNHTLAIKNDGSVWTWGYNASGQLGDGTTYTKTVPVKIEGLTDIVYIAASKNSHSIAVKANQTAFAWGYNGYGQLGTGATGNQSSPVQVTGLGDVDVPDVINFVIPAPFTPGQNNCILDAGSFHSLMINEDDPDRTVWAWGYNGYGELGDGSTTSKVSPVQVNGLEDVISIAGGSMHSVALKDDGTVYAWGLNNYGQVGDGTTVNKLNFVKVTPLENIVAIAAGGQYNGDHGYVGHSLALKNDGTVWAWGYNNYGGLGDCTYTYRSSPVKVNGIDHVAKIACGSLTSYALKNDGSVWAWGYNGHGQLGDGTTINKPVPVKVESLTGIEDIAPGSWHILALKDNDTLYSWGWNGQGQLGDATTTNRSLPVIVTSISDIDKIACGPAHSFVVRNDGSLWAWGYNGYGNLGDNTTISKLTPAYIPYISNVIHIAANQGYNTGTIYSYSLAMTSDGTVLGWGYNGHGEIGDGTTTSKYIPTQTNTPW